MALKCFVAMAFGREDTDRVYDNLIAPLLKRNGVIPIRVDRQEHNDDINNKIVSLLQTSDFAIADLTYARPSVYFEAGFAQRRNPVIYTCRGDHLRPTAKDSFGNFRVHFDLLMKNIIPWASPSDGTFAAKLSKRIAHTIAPLVRLERAKGTESQEAERFAALSLRERTQRILRAWTLRLEDTGYEGSDIKLSCLAQGCYFQPTSWYRRFDPRAYDMINRVRALRPGWMGTRLVRGTIQVAVVHVAESLTKSRLSDLAGGVLAYSSYNINKPAKLDRIRNLHENFILCSLDKVPRSRVMSALPDFELDIARQEFVAQRTATLPSIPLPSGLEVYELGEWFQEDHHGASRFIVRTREKPERFSTTLEEVGLPELGALVGTAVLKVKKVRSVPRRICVRIIDNISSERILKEVCSQTLQSIGSHS